MRVPLSTIGGRGKVEPLLVLGVRLKRMGRRVRLCASPEFHGLVEFHGLEFARIGPVGWEKALRDPERIVPAIVANQFATLRNAAADCDVVVGGNQLLVTAPTVAESLGTTYLHVAQSPIGLQRIAERNAVWIDGLNALRGVGTGTDRRPEEERIALWEAVGRILERAVTGRRRPDDVEKLICAAGHIEQDLTPWLRHLDLLTGAEADAGIAALVEHWAQDIGEGHEPSLWWYPDNPARPVRDWLRSDGLRGRLSQMDTRAGAGGDRPDVTRVAPTTRRSAPPRVQVRLIPKVSTGQTWGSATARSARTRLALAWARAA
ncbi:glycosyltransferase [Kutzneria buriramensis]|uniref:Glycosyl transferase family 28 n=1 Tax=Kutzneria buriramensis TaxID=1045776 RepID=A0A3E0GSZ4_9PSEU|nr:glycosyltransferase [Kutzneria buriramensis]REH26166.1 glycosyl transferase family 28 [Kutzneria buriramensis]